MRKRGQALAEMAAVMGVLIALALGGVNLGQAMLASYTLNQAAREAAHQAAITGGDNQRATAVAQAVIAAGVGMEVRQANIQVACQRNPCRRYDPITVTIRYQSEFWAPIPGLSRFSLSANATRASERDRQ